MKSITKNKYWNFSGFFKRCVAYNRGTILVSIFRVSKNRYQINIGMFTHCEAKTLKSAYKIATKVIAGKRKAEKFNT